MAVLAPPVQVVTANAPPFVHVPSGAPPFVAVSGNAPPIMIVESGAPPITLFNEDGSIWAGAGGGPVGGGDLLLGENDGFATDFTYATDASRVALKASSAITYYGVDSFYQNAGTSPKMVYDASGVLGWSPHNLLPQSQAFDFGGWSKVGTTATANAILAPNGLLEAAAVIEDIANSAHYTATNCASITGSSFSVYAKAGARSRIVLSNATGSAGDGFDLSNGTTFVIGGFGTTGGAVITSAGSGWYRCSIPLSGTESSVYIWLYNGSVTYTGDGVSGVYLWGAQLNRGSAPLAYLPTTTASRVGLALDYDPVTHAAKGLLCEPAATNLAQQSQDLSAFVTAEGGTVTVNNQTGPDGTLIADTFTENTATINHGCYASVSVTANTDYTLSRFMKMGTRRYASLGWSDGTNGAYAVYDLQSGAVGSSAAFGTGVLNSASIQALPNSWYRCILSGKFPTGTTAYYTQQAATAATITPDGFGRQTFVGTSATLFMGHVQVEAGTVATSPIPTLAASVTRAADIVSVTPASINYSATAGSWWVDINSLTNAAGKRIIGTQSGGGGAPIHNETATSFAFFDPGGSYKAKPVTSVLGTHKVAVAFQTADVAITADGLAVATDTGATTGTLSPGTSIGFGTNPIGPADNWNGYIRKLRYVPRRKSNAELVTETIEDAVPGGGALLFGEANGFATDFLYATDAQRVALKSSGSTLAYAVDSFYANAGTSPKMVYDVAGTLVWSPHNLMLQSQTFDNASWSVFGTASKGAANAATAPDGTLTADAVSWTAGAAQVYQNSAGLAAATTYTMSVYAKRNAGTNQTFRLKAIIPTDLYSSDFTATDTWQRFSFPFTTAGGGGGGHGLAGDSAGTAANILVWGAQLNLGTVPTAYIPTTTAARVGLALDYDPVTHAPRGLLCEPQATNGQTRSSDFDNANWAKNECTVTANAVIAPNGLTEADAIIPANAVGGRPFVNWTATTTAATVTTYSLFAKNGTLGNNWIEIQIGGAPTVAAWFNLATGVVGTATGSPISRTITAVGNGWYRLTVTFTAGAGSAATYLCADSGDGIDSGNGNGTSPAFYLWGTQMEAGTVATSYIPTLAASVTRAADQYNVTPASINYSATAGSWWVDIDLIAQGPASDRLIGQQNIGAAIFVYWGASAFTIYDVAVLAGPLSTLTNPSKVAVAFANSDRAVTVNGLAPSTDTSAGSMVLTPGAFIGIGNNGSGGDQINGYIRKVRYLPRRPTNAELQTMTT